MPSEESKAIRLRLHKETGKDEVPLAEQRKAWSKYAESLAIDPRVVQINDTIQGVPCLWLKHKKSPMEATIVYAHGGGLVDGSMVTHREFVSRIVAETSYRALIVGYRLAPENPFPAALEDFVNVYCALPGNYEYILGGDSSGGGLVVAALAQIRKLNQKPPSCAFAISGVFDMTLSGGSMKSLDSIDPCLSYAALKRWTQYFGGFDLRDERISPLFGSVEGLPPILLQAGDHEVWRDDSIRLKAKIDAAGGSATLSIWESMWHVWPMYSELPEALDAIKEIGTHIATHLLNTQNFV